MPWNLSASIHGSRAGSLARGAPFHPPSSIGGFPSASAGQPSSIIPPLPGSLDRRQSRLTSASPLVGRGRDRFSSIDLPIPEAAAADEILAGADVSSLGAVDDFQLYGPAAGVTTQQAAESQWLRATLDQESNNFLEFVKVEIAAKPLPPAAEEEDELAGATKRSMFFGELLPPERHTKTVAAQGLHHVLALATKGLLRVQQREHYGAIALQVVGGL